MGAEDIGSFFAKRRRRRYRQLVLLHLVLATSGKTQQPEKVQRARGTALQHWGVKKGGLVKETGGRGESVDGWMWTQKLLQEEYGYNKWPIALLRTVLIRLTFPFTATRTHLSQ
jgi:hypothetical protein